MVYHMNKYCKEHIKTCHGLHTTVHHKTQEEIVSVTVCNIGYAVANFSKSI